MYAEGESKPLAVYASGRGAADVEVVPASLVLPRASGSGPLYSGVCVCRSVSGKSPTVSAVSVPAGITVGLPKAPGPPHVRVTWDPVGGKGLAGRDAVPVRLKAELGGRVTELEILVACRGSE